jgi:hypothetical protein
VIHDKSQVRVGSIITEQPADSSLRWVMYVTEIGVSVDCISMIVDSAPWPSGSAPRFYGLNSTCCISLDNPELFLLEEEKVTA